MSHYNTHLEISGVDGCETAVTVHYIYVKFRAGRTDGRGGLKLEPDETERIEIDWIEGPDGQPIDVTQKMETALEEEIGEWLDGYYDPPEPDCGD